MLPDSALIEIIVDVFIYFPLLPVSTTGTEGEYNHIITNLLLLSLAVLSWKGLFLISFLLI